MIFNMYIPGMWLLGEVPLYTLSRFLAILYRSLTLFKLLTTMPLHFHLLGGSSAVTDSDALTTHAGLNCERNACIKACNQRT
jgi:succinate-acetate transporter protein